MATRGYGLLEGFLANQRFKHSRRLIRSSFYKDRILDVGGGVYPSFLLKVDFSEMYCLDKSLGKKGTEIIQNQKITFINCDLEIEQNLPFDSHFFDVITMLAVLEHIEPSRIVDILKELHRILRTNGMLIITTPALWTDRLLRLLANLKLVSPVEIEEHKAVYNKSRLYSVIQEGGFSKDNIQFGYFEMFMNSWARAIKKS
jgi:2-polyprenyl-3-methyl-5-hydroxy-6-metoxy-1,4-benzoquinol methylase